MQYTTLKSFISATSNVSFYFFLPILGFGEEDPKGASCQDDQEQFFNVFNQDAGFFWIVCFIPQIPEQTSDWE